MSSLAALVATRGPIRRGDEDGDDVRALQLALSQAGYKVGIDGAFGAQTEHSVQTFQTQHGLKPVDGIVGSRTAALLDSPHEHLVATAKPLAGFVDTPAGTIATPHDDTASLLAFYGKPWEDGTLMTFVMPPFEMFYGAQRIRQFQVHTKIHAPLVRALAKIWDAAGQDNNSDILQHVKHFDGCYNYRPIRGSSRLSCHAFGAALDFDATALPLGRAVAETEMPQQVVAAFESEGFYWGGRFRGRKDPQHLQMAHE